jgi:branched-chain amino acid aminotransferase
LGRLAVIDGEQRSPERATVSVYDRGFLYGDSVFETVRTYAGRLFALDEHLARLEDSAAKMGLELPVSKAALAKETADAVAAAGNPESYTRIMLTRGTGPVGLDTSLAKRATRVILVEPLLMPPPDHYEHGLTAVCVETVRASDAADSAKLGNYLASALALRKAREAGAHEALVVNRNGLVVEGTTSNVFAVVAGTDGPVLVTPAVEDGVLAGITRQYLLRMAEQESVGVRYRAMSRDEIVRSDEVFLTSSIREVMPIVAIDGHTIGSGKPGPITQRLHRAFRRFVGMDGKLPFEVGGLALDDG